MQLPAARSCLFSPSPVGRLRRPAAQNHWMSRFDTSSEALGMPRDAGIRMQATSIRECISSGVADERLSSGFRGVETGPSCRRGSGDLRRQAGWTGMGACSGSLRNRRPRNTAPNPRAHSIQQPHYEPMAPMAYFFGYRGFSTPPVAPDRRVVAGEPSPYIC